MNGQGKVLSEKIIATAKHDKYNIEQNQTIIDINPAY